MLFQFEEMGLVTFNIDNGYLEAIVRGYKSGLLNSGQYTNLSQCESIDGEFICVGWILIGIDID